MESKNVIILASLLTLFGVSSCKKDEIKKATFSFTKIRPSSHLASDGILKLNSNNIEVISSIEWTKFNSNFTSSEVNLSNLSPGCYYYNIQDINGLYYRDSILLASLDTIEPLEYFPAYPGSYWVYNNNDTLWCSDEYEKAPLYSDGLVYPGIPEIPIDSIYIVRLFRKNHSTGQKNWGAGVFGYVYLYELAELNNTQEQFFCENLDCEFDISGYRPLTYGWTFCKKIVNDTTIILNNKVFNNTQVIEKATVSDYSLMYLYVEYYAKDVGLIKREKAVDYENGIYETVSEIVTYEIKKPKK